MAHVLTVIPKGCRTIKKSIKLSCLKENADNIQKRLDCAKQTKKVLDAELDMRNVNLQRSKEAAGKLDTIG